MNHWGNCFTRHHQFIHTRKSVEKITFLNNSNFEMELLFFVYNHLLKIISPQNQNKCQKMARQLMYNATILQHNL